MITAVVPTFRPDIEREIDLIEEICRRSVAFAEKGLRDVQLGFNVSGEPGSLGNPLLRDVAVRTAIQYAVDRTKLVQLCLSGHGQPGDTIVPAGLADWHYAVPPGAAQSGYDRSWHAADFWSGMWAPAGTPKEIVARLNKETVASIRMKEISDQLLKEGTVPTPSSPEEFGAYIKTEIDKWGAVVRMANIKGE